MSRTVGSLSSQWDAFFEEITNGRAFSRGHRINANAGQTGEVDSTQLTAFHRAAAATSLLGMGHNLLTGVDVSAAELRYSVSTSLLGNDIGTWDAIAGIRYSVWERWGPNISPGEGYSITAVTTGRNYAAWFDWLEFDL